MTTSTSVGQKLWNYCNVLRDAGLSYGDYLEQLTFLLFLKMMHERTQPPFTFLPDYRPPPSPTASTGPACSIVTAMSSRPTTAARWKPWLGSPARLGSSSTEPGTRSRNPPC